MDSHVQPLVLTLNFFDTFYTQFDDQSDVYAGVYPSNLADVDLVWFPGSSDPERYTHERPSLDTGRLRLKWPVVQFLGCTERIDEIRTGSHCRQDANAHFHKMIVDLDNILTTLQGV